MRVGVWLLASMLAACGPTKGWELIAEQSIGVDGGTVAAPDGSVSLVVPAGALSEDTTLTIEALDPDGAAAAELSEVVVAGMAYRFSPAGLDFAELSELAMAIPADLEDADRDALLMAEHLGENTFELDPTARLADDRDQVVGSLRGFSTHVAVWAARGCPTPPTVTADLTEPRAITVSWAGASEGLEVAVIENDLAAGENRFRPDESDWRPLRNAATGSIRYGVGLNAALYFFRVKANCGGSQGIVTMTTWPVALFGDLPPTKSPGDFRVVSTGSASIELAWSPVKDTDQHLIQRKIKGSTDPRTQIADLGWEALSYVDSPLLANTTYEYWLTATSTAGSARAVGPIEGKTGGTLACGDFELDIPSEVTVPQSGAAAPHVFPILRKATEQEFFVTVQDVTKYLPLAEYASFTLCASGFKNCTYHMGRSLLVPGDAKELDFTLAVSDTGVPVGATSDLTFEVMVGAADVCSYSAAVRVVGP